MNAILPLSTIIKSLTKMWNTYPNDETRYGFLTICLQEKVYISHTDLYTNLEDIKAKCAKINFQYCHVAYKVLSKKINITCNKSMSV